MFSISSEPLDTAQLNSSLADSVAGALVVFEGWVRNHNEGRPVASLEYEIFEALALQEGNKIIDEAKKRFDVLDIGCVHRHGHLQIGENAVWVGVISAHREVAFKACRYVIDEIKLRLPIWKKEHYVSGESTWVNCQGCYHHSANRVDEKSFYSQQVCLSSVQEVGQERLKKTKVLVVGAGGLGSPVLTYLAAAGVGHITIVDFDKLEVSNLHRQTLYSHEDIGGFKADLAKKRLIQNNPFISVEARVERLTTENIESLVSSHDIAVDCTDNFATKFLLHDACYLIGRPLVQASIYQFEGQIQFYHKNVDAGCMRCLWPEIPANDCVKSCADVGVMGYVPGVIGALQAQEAIRYILGEIPESSRQSIFIDLHSMSVHKVQRPRVAQCPLCSADAQINKIVASEYENVKLPYEIEAADLEKIFSGKFDLIDIRPVDELKALPKEKNYILVCNKGVSSRRLAKELQDNGYHHFYSLLGGRSTLSERTRPVGL